MYVYFRISFSTDKGIPPTTVNSPRYRRSFLHPSWHKRDHVFIMSKPHPDICYCIGAYIPKPEGYLIVTDFKLKILMHIRIIHAFISVHNVQAYAQAYKHKQIYVWIQTQISIHAQTHTCADKNTNTNTHKHIPIVRVLWVRGTPTGDFGAKTGARLVPQDIAIIPSQILFNWVPMRGLRVGGKKA